MAKWIQRKPKIKFSSNDSLIEKIAKIRGIEDLERFLNPDKNELFSPTLLKNIQKATERIVKAIEENQRVVVAYDHDTDGLTSGTIMVKYLNNYISEVDFIYSERSHGHGIAQMIKTSDVSDERMKLADSNIEKIKNADLLIIVDSSSNDEDACKQIVDKMNTDVLIIDHHDVDVVNTHVILVNPKQEGCQYPNKHLSGAGVTFKVIQLTEQMLRYDELGKADISNYLDLVAVGMHSDMMRMDVPENRFLVMYGMSRIRNHGLERILKDKKTDLNKVNSSSIAFSISPLLNSAARMDRMDLAIDLLLKDDYAGTLLPYTKMKELNLSKKIKQEKMLESYLAEIDTTARVIMVVSDQSFSGFNGIVAQELSKRYKRPVMVGRRDKGKIKGSFRGYNDYQMRSFLNSFKGMWTAGHEPAGGFSFDEGLLPKFLDYVEVHAEDPGDTSDEIVYDLDVDVEEITQDMIDDIQDFNYLYGQGFEKVTVVIRNIEIKEKKVLGETRETCKFSTFNGIELIRFRVNEEYGEDLECFTSSDVLGELQMNEFYSNRDRKIVKTPQIIVEDYKIND